MAKFGIEWVFSRRARRLRQFSSVWSVGTYVPGPILLAKFGDRVGLCPPSVESPAVFGHSLAGAIEWIIARHSDAFLRHSGHIPLLSNFSIRRPVAAVPILPPQRRLFSLVMELGRIWY